MDSFGQILPWLFLLRIPLIFLLIALLFPYLALRRARSLLENLYDVDPRGAGYSVLATMALAWSVLFTGYITLRHGERFGPELVTWTGLGPGWPITALFLLPVVPTLIGMRHRMRSDFTAAHWRACAVAVAGGVALAFAMEQVVVPAIEWIQAVVPAGYLPRGYVEGGKVSGSHILAFGAFLLALGTYAVVGLLPRPRVPTLAYLNVFLAIVCWTLAGAAFLLDAFRFPLLLAIAVVLFISGYVVRRKSDHYFAVVTCHSSHPPLPQDVLTARPEDPVIVVAANGGGIQSAAWTTCVLAGLDRRWRANSADKDRFRRSIRLISGVSGGSVGTMHFLSTWDGTTGDDAVRNAKTSSLADVAWGLVYPDFITLLLPWTTKRLADRGNALEASWVRTGATGVDRPLSDRYDDVRHGRRPAVVLNATITETGERVLLGTTRIPSKEGDGRRNLGEVLKGCDVKAVTAARLSATFPFVTPVARPDSDQAEGFHLADGGYYDNYGTVTAIEWLHEGLTNMKHRPARVLLLELHGAPSKKPREGSSRGWAYQLFAPIACMLSVRTAGQEAHKTLEIDLVREYWATQGVIIEFETFEFGRLDPPLSWHLSKAEKQAVDDEFEACSSQWDKVRRFLEQAHVAKV